MKDISSTLLLHLEKYAHVISFHMQYITQFQYIPLFIKYDNVLKTDRKGSKKITR